MHGYLPGSQWLLAWWTLAVPWVVNKCITSNKTNRPEIFFVWTMHVEVEHNERKNAPFTCFGNGLIMIWILEVLPVYSFFYSNEI